MHKFAIPAPGVLALPSRSHSRAFLRSDGSSHPPGIKRAWLRYRVTRRCLPGANMSRLVDDFGLLAASRFFLALSDAARRVFCSTASKTASPIFGQCRSRSHSSAEPVDSLDTQGAKCFGKSCKFAGVGPYIEEPQNAARLCISIDCLRPSPTYRGCVGAVVPVRSLHDEERPTAREILWRKL